MTLLAHAHGWISPRLVATFHPPAALSRPARNTCPAHRISSSHLCFCLEYQQRPSLSISFYSKNVLRSQIAQGAGIATTSANICIFCECSSNPRVYMHTNAHTSHFSDFPHFGIAKVHRGRYGSIIRRHTNLARAQLSIERLRKVGLVNK